MIIFSVFTTRIEKHVHLFVPLVFFFSKIKSLFPLPLSCQALPKPRRRSHVVDGKALRRHFVPHGAREAGRIAARRLLEVRRLASNPLLSACSVPLIRRLASAMQWAHWKVVFFFPSMVAEWKPPPPFVQLQLHETNKHTIKHKETSKSGSGWKSIHCSDCAFNILFFLCPALLSCVIE